MKKFKVTVDGQSYTVEVEEVKSDTGLKPASLSVTKDETAKQGASVSKPEIKAESPVKDTQSIAGKNSSGSAASSPTGSGTSIKAPMPGSVLDVKVKPGDEVQNGDVLLVLEAMKMENELTSSIAGKVTEVLVKKGDTVNSGDPLVIIA